MRWEQCLDRVQVSVTGPQSQKVLWDWQKGTARLGTIKPILGGFTAWVSRRRLPQLEQLVRRHSGELKVLQVRGPGQFLAPYHARLGLVAGPLCFLAAVQLWGNLVWHVEYLNFTPAQKVLVQEKLLETGLQEGQRVTQEKLRQAEQELLSQNQAFGWVSLNFVDGRLTAECTTAMNQPAFPEDHPWDLVAAVDGVILSQDVPMGFTQTRVGDRVTQGQVLVSCYKLDHNGQPVWQQTRGQVMARFSWEYTYAQPLTVTAQVPRPGGTTQVELWAGSLRRTIRGEQGPGQGQVEYQPLTFLGLALPATLVTTYYPEYAAQTFTFTQEGAAQLARYQCQNRLLEEFPGAQVLEEQAQQQVKDGVLYYQWQVQACGNIARPATQAPTVESIEDE